MSDTVKLVQDAHSVTATRKHLKKTIDYGTTAEIAAYTGNRGELIFNANTSAIKYMNGVNAGGSTFAVATIIAANTASLPTASADNRGHIYTVAATTANTADSFVVCGVATSNSTVTTYAWNTITV